MRRDNAVHSKKGDALYHLILYHSRDSNQRNQSHPSVSELQNALSKIARTRPSRRKLSFGGDYVSHVTKARYRNLNRRPVGALVYA
jgi:hypothetical protein